MSEWISVDNFLPAPNEEVLMYTEGGITSGCWGKDRWGHGDKFSWQEYYTCDGPACYGGCPKVTHWMPLPEYPKEED